MNKNVKLKGRLALFYNWPIILMIILAVLNLGLYLYDAKSGFFLSGILVIGGIATAVVYTLNGHYMIQEIVGFATQYSTVQKKLINELAIPYVLLDSSGKVMWANEKFHEATGVDKKYHKSITSLFPTITKEFLQKNEDITE